MKLTKSKLTLIIPVISLLLLLFIIPDGNDVIAQQPGPDINHWTYDASAGGVSKGTTYAVRGTLGQHSVYSSSNVSNTVSSGIWEGHKHLSPQAPEILVLEKEYRDLEAPVESGDNLAFIVAVTNNGDDPQTNVVITDTIPAGLTLVSGSAEIDSSKGRIDAVYSDTIVASSEQLSYEQIVVLTYRAIVEADRGETITGTVTARSDTYGPITDYVNISVLGPNAVYLPLVTRNYSPVTEPVVEPLLDAPDRVPGHRIDVDNHICRDDFDDENDNDWYVFQAEEGQTYTIETNLIGEEADTAAALYDTDGTTKLAENDDIDWPVNVASRIVWTAPSNGDYHVLIRSYDWRVYGDGTDYQLQIERGGSADSMEAASELQPSKPIIPPTPHPGE